MAYNRVAYNSLWYNSQELPRIGYGKKKDIIMCDVKKISFI
jgi:hypothetical protein